MPLSLGWDTDPGDEETPPDSTIPGLLLSDIGTGATRLVTARWMHALYKHIQDTQRPGTLVLHLHEASYTARFSWAHALILGALLLQFLVIPVAMLHGQQREGWLLLAAGLIRIGEGVFAWAYPMYREPRMTYPKRRADPLSDDTAPLRYCALHTGMTTHHILVITHRFGYHGKCVNLEDAAVPLPRKATGWRSRIQDGARAGLRLSVWLQKGASVVTFANGYTIPAVLLFGTSVLEFVSASADALPARAVTVLPTGPSVLDRLAAACQFTDSISIGFVESLLPDPRGHHTDFEWINQAMQPGMCLSYSSVSLMMPSLIIFIFAFFFLNTRYGSRSASHAPHARSSAGVDSATAETSGPIIQPPAARNPLIGYIYFIDAFSCSSGVSTDRGQGGENLDARTSR
jgi:hypothetical protein